MKAHYGYAVLEDVSLANAKNIRDATRSITGLQIPQSGDLDIALKDFGTICQLRHAAVHSAGILGSENARKIDSSLARLCAVSLDLVRLQQLISVCDNLVRTYNQHLFDKLVARWAEKGILTWDWQVDAKIFSRFYLGFRSATDSTGPNVAYTAYRRVRSVLK